MKRTPFFLAFGCLARPDEGWCPVTEAGLPVNQEDSSSSVRKEGDHFENGPGTRPNRRGILHRDRIADRPEHADVGWSRSSGSCHQVFGGIQRMYFHLQLVFPSIFKISLSILFC